MAVDGGSITRDAGAAQSIGLGSAVFGALTRWLRERTTLPVWWTEFHVGLAPDEGQPRLVASSVAALLHMADEGASVASTHMAGGGVPLALADAVARLQQLLAAPADGDLVWWPLAEVGVVAGREAMLVVNTADKEMALRIRGLPLRLAPYEVRYVPLPPGLPPVPPQWWTPSVDRCLHDEPQPTPRPGRRLP